MYSLTTSHSLDGWDIEADWSYTVTLVGGKVDGLTLDAMRIEKRPVEPPAWLEGWLRPLPDTLIEHANECAQSAAEDAAEYRRGMMRAA